MGEKLQELSEAIPEFGKLSYYNKIKLLSEHIPNWEQKDVHDLIGQLEKLLTSEREESNMAEIPFTTSVFITSDDIIAAIRSAKNIESIKAILGNAGFSRESIRSILAGRMPVLVSEENAVISEEAIAKIDEIRAKTRKKAAPTKPSVEAKPKPFANVKEALKHPFVIIIGGLLGIGIWAALTSRPPEERIYRRRKRRY